MGRSRRKGTGKPPFLVAYTEMGERICDYMIVDMGKGKSAVLPIPNWCVGVWRKTMRPYMAGERKVVWRGRLGRMLWVLANDPGKQKYNGAFFYKILMPLILGRCRRRDKIKILKKIGVLKSSKTSSK